MAWVAGTVVYIHVYPWAWHYLEWPTLYGMTYLPISVTLIHWHLLKPNLKLIYSLNTIKRNYTNITAPVNILWNGTNTIQIHYYYYYYYYFDHLCFPHLSISYYSWFHGYVISLKTWDKQAQNNPILTCQLIILGCGQFCDVRICIIII